MIELLKRALRRADALQRLLWFRVAASVLVGVHAMVDFSLQLPAVALLYALIMGVACAQSWSSVDTR